VAERFKVIAQSVLNEEVYDKSHKITGTQMRFALGTREYERVLIMILNYVTDITFLVSEERNRGQEALSKSKRWR
jgi:hypothetical protein